MRKNDLIELLNGIEGNPELGIWNGMVCDVVGVRALVPVVMERPKFEYWASLVRAEQKQDGATTVSSDEELRKLYKKNCRYEVLDGIPDNRKNNLYKVVWTFDAKFAGRRYSDRVGAIDY